jgi:hypothetical protein
MLWIWRGNLEPEVWSSLSCHSFSMLQFEGILRLSGEQYDQGFFYSSVGYRGPVPMLWRDDVWILTIETRDVGRYFSITFERTVVFFKRFNVFGIARWEFG